MTTPSSTSKYSVLFFNHVFNNTTKSLQIFLVNKLKQKSATMCRMSDFDVLLAEYTEKGNAKVHGVICKCVDRNGIPLFKLSFILRDIDTDIS